MLGTLRGMTAVKAWLDGHQFELNSLARLLPSGDTQVVPDGAGGYYLTAAEIDNRPTGTPLYEAAPAVLRLVNGLARVLLHAGFRPVALSGRYQDGDRGHLVVAPKTVECRARVMPVTVLVDGESVGQAPTSIGPAHALVASANGNVRDVLEIMGAAEEPGWVELYRAFEIMQHTGQLTEIAREARVSEKKIRCFCRTANHPDAAGALARHGRSKAEPPQEPMPLMQARKLIRDLVRAWMDVLNPP